MADTAQLLPKGIYHITVAGLGEIGPDRLTRHGGDVATILPPGAAPEAEQEWLVIPLPNGNILIERPSNIRPATYLTYKGAPERPKEGDQVVYHVAEFPPNEWHVGIAPGFRVSIHVAHSELGIRVAGPKIYPPFLELADKDQLFWVFQRVRDAEH